MNARTLELIRDPKKIIEQDLPILQKEIRLYPYLQHLRAIHLYGVFLYDHTNYSKTLSTTAAYTTDKKILYEFINGKIISETEPLLQDLTTEKSMPTKVICEEISSEEEIPKLSEVPNIQSIAPVDEVLTSQSLAENKEILEPSESFETIPEPSENIACQIPVRQTIESVSVNGEKNRILFSGEEDFLEKPLTEQIDLDATLESGKIVTFIPKLVEKSTDSISNEAPLNKVDEKETPLNYHSTDSFLPNVAIDKKSNTLETKAPISTVSNTKYEDEMKKLIEEVENKMKMKKKSETSESRTIEDLETPQNNEINFAETPSLDWQKENESTKKEEISSEASPEKIQNHSTPRNWTPMQVSLPSFDSSEKSEKNSTKNSTSSTTEPIIEEKKPNENEAMPNAQENTESNVPTFINTWQNWLKIDRAITDKKEIDIEEIKTKVIDTFIEKNPKISQLKDEVAFVVKEKTDDISHLMTETLANIYWEQKLSAKAINAFMILSKKHPEKKDYFLNKIQEIKDQKNKTDKA